MNKTETTSRVNKHFVHYPILRNPRLNNRHIISSYKRSLTTLKILSFVGVCLACYFVYVNINSIANKTQPVEHVEDEQKILPKDDTTEYEAKILNSSFKGVNEKLNYYQVNSHYATKTLSNGYTLEDISAIYELNKEQLLVITAKDAIMNRETQIIKLHNDVVFTLGEAKLRAKDVEFNLLNKETFSETGVILDYKHSKISAKDFSTTNDNNILNFKNKVSTIIDVSDF